MIKQSGFYQTKRGGRVHILSYHGRGKYPIMGYIGIGEHLYYWTLDGKSYSGDESLDLVPIKIRQADHADQWEMIFEQFEIFNANKRVKYNLSTYLKRYFQAPDQIGEYSDIDRVLRAQEEANYNEIEVGNPTESKRKGDDDGEMDRLLDELI